MKSKVLFALTICLLLSHNHIIAQKVSETSEKVNHSELKDYFAKNEAVHFDSKLLIGNWILDFSLSDKDCKDIFDKESYINFISESKANVFFNEHLELYYKLENDILFLTNKEGDYYRDSKQRCQVVMLTSKKLVLLAYYNNKKIQLTLNRN